MKFYEIIIKPKSAFATSLKGDTIFGNLCWHIDSVSSLLQNYKTNPFLVVSSAIILFKDNNCKKYIFNRPNAPEEMLFEKGDNWVETRKERKQKKYFILEEKTKFENIKKINYKTLKEINNYFNIDDENSCFFNNINLQHNTINRETFTTGDNQFAPWTISANLYNEIFNLVIFVAIDDTIFSKEQLQKSFEILGKVGFGKKSSIGYGKFDVLEINETNIFSNNNGNYYYTLAPCVPQQNEIDETKSYYQSFTRFGKHGDILAKSDNPFKRPIIMIDENALIKPNKPIDTNCPIIGSAITNVSNIDNKIVSQGYTLCLTTNVEEI